MPVDAVTAPPRETSLDPRVERSRAAILKATSELIAEEGFAACTIDAVVKRTGIAKATIYRHWAGREALLKTAIDELCAPGEAPDTGSLRGDLIAFFAARARDMDDNPFSRRLRSLPAIFEAARRDPEFAELSAKFVDGLIVRLSEILARARRRREIGPDGELTAMAHLILGGLMIRQGLYGGAAGDSNVLAQEVDLVVSAFRRPGRRKPGAAKA